MALIALPPKFSFGKINKWGLLRAGNTIRSRFTGSSQRIVYPYAVWAFEGELIDYPEPEAAAIRAFLTALEGQKNTFNMPVPGWSASNANIANPNVTYGVYGGSSAVIRTNHMGLSVGGPGVIYFNPDSSYFAHLKIGDYFQIGNELKIVTGNILLNAGGADQISFDFQPALRASYPHGTLLTVRNPSCVMSSIDDDAGIFSLSPPVKHSFGLKAIEAF